MFGGLVVFLAVACLRWRHQARSVVKHLNERFITGKCLLGKSKVQGQRRAFEWRVPREIGRCFSFLDRVFVLLSTLYVKNPDLRSLIPDFASDILSPSSVWLPKPMSDGKFMCTLRSFLELIGVTRKVAQGVKYNYIRRFLPTLGEVLRVDTTEAQSLSNWVEIAKGRDRREARANHPTSRLDAGDKLTSSGLVKAMCIEALCQAVTHGSRDCKASLMSITWYDVRVALPDLDQAWQQVLHGPKKSSTHTGEEVSQNILPIGVTIADSVEAELPNCEQSSGHHAADPFCLFDTIDAAEVVVPCADPATTVAPQPSTEVQFQPLKENLQGFYTIMPAPKLQPLPSSRTASPSHSRTRPLRCCRPISLAQHGVHQEMEMSRPHHKVAFVLYWARLRGRYPSVDWVLVETGPWPGPISRELVSPDSLPI